MPIELHPEWRARFRQELADAGFVQEEATPGREGWCGAVTVAWNDPASGTACEAQHRVCISLGPGFPFEKPVVAPTDDDVPPGGRRHQAPSRDGRGAFCLWQDGEAGWRPWMTAEDLLGRVRDWYAHAHRDDWPAADRPPDLHLAFPVDGGCPLMLISDDWQPPASAAAGSFGVWQAGPRFAFAGSPTGALIRQRGMHADRALAHLGLVRRPCKLVGLWLRLRREPLPCATLAAILDEADRAAGQPAGWSLKLMRELFGDRPQYGRHYALLALGYPDADREEHWLFLRTELAWDGKRLHWVAPEALARLRVTSYETASIGRSALMRRTGHLARTLAGRRVLIFGQGAVGGSVTTLLTKAGIERLRVVDGDRLRPGNAVRHVAGLGAVGTRKVDASRAEALSHTPDCSITGEWPSWDPEVLARWVGEADVVVDATASPAFSHLLNEICVRVKRPVVYVASYRRATIGRVLVVRPGRDACLSCHDAGYFDADGYPVIPPGEEGSFIETGCGTPTVEASAVDIEAAANWAARAALWLLRGTLGADNLCLVVNEPLADAPRPLGRIGVHWSCWTPIPGCAACGVLQEAAP